MLITFTLSEFEAKKEKNKYTSKSIKKQNYKKNRCVRQHQKSSFGGTPHTAVLNFLFNNS